MAMRVEIDGLSNIPYSEYLLTGFHILKRQGIIDGFRVTCAPGVNTGQIHRYLDYAKDRLGREKPAPSDEWSHIVGAVSEGTRKRRFAVNILDTPWDFSSPRFIDRTDVYFKCQYPKDFKKGFFQLSSRNRIRLPEFVVTQSHKVRPLMLGRPLSRCLDFSKNIRMLRAYERARKRQSRRFNVLVYFGMANDDFDIPDSHHPHLKRAKVAAWVNKNIPNSKVILTLAQQEKFLKQLEDDAMTLGSNDRVRYKQYFGLVRDSYSTFNIMGLRGSVPFRVIDSFLSGMVLISDNMRVEWYDPLVPGKDYFSVGDLGYELLEDVDVAQSCEELRNHVDGIEHRYRDTMDYRDTRFRRAYSPESVAAYVLNEVLNSP